MNQVSLDRHGLKVSALCLATLVLAFAAPVALAGTAGNTAPIDPEQFSTIGSTTIVGEGDLQVETGVSRTQDGSGSKFLRAWSTPTLLRFGMPNYEIRLATNAYSRVRTYSAVNTGMSDMTLGLKGVVPQLWDKDLSLSMLVQTGLPSGSPQIKNNGVRPELRFIGAWQLPNQISIGATAGVRSDLDVTGGRFPTGLLGVNFTHTWSPTFLTYGEMTAQTIRSASHGGKDMLWGLGAGWRALPGTQLDATVGFGLKNNDTDRVFRLGVSRRFHPPAPGQWSHKQDKKPEETPSATTEDGQ